MRFGSDAGAKYDLDFKSPNKLGQNFKSGKDMIEMYKELCNGMSSFLYIFFVFSSAALCFEEQVK